MPENTGRVHDWLANPLTRDEAWAARLLELGFAVQRHLAGVAEQVDTDTIEPVAIEGGDTIYPLDRRVEPVIEQVIESWPSACKPLVLVVEGMGADGRKTVAAEPGDTPLNRVIIDPIDGTRGLMYGKRSAWFLAAVAPERGNETRLADAFAAVMVELPTAKQCWADAFAAVASRPAAGERTRIGGSEAIRLSVRPSQATRLTDGFAQVSNFFPGTKVLAADLMERIAAANSGIAADAVFDDQYISTGGQMVELMLGRDRFCCDLRPLFHRIVARQTRRLGRGIECHPYDVAGALVARQAGVILTDGFGRPLDGPLVVDHGIHWCGYANAAIQALVEPVIGCWLADHEIEPD
jgi:fructose-1,6-bisphosphatase/inositol monophosphatase family enzyme